MSVFLLDTDEETNGKINIDELYENKHKRDLKQLSIFNKILNRIHKRIQFVGKNKKNDNKYYDYVYTRVRKKPSNILIHVIRFKCKSSIETHILYILYIIYLW